MFLGTPKSAFCGFPGPRKMQKKIPDFCNIAKKGLKPPNSQGDNDAPRN